MKEEKITKLEFTKHSMQNPNDKKFVAEKIKKKAKQEDEDYRLSCKKLDELKK